MFHEETKNNNNKTIKHECTNADIVLELWTETIPFSPEMSRTFYF